MTITIRLVLMILAIVFLIAAALGVQSPRGNLMAAGLAFWALAVTIG